MNFYRNHIAPNFASPIGFVLLMLFIGVVGYGQNETDHWHFGKSAGLDFSEGEFAVVNTGTMDTPAGCASISDLDGSLKLYSNGENVWNAAHEIMTNGSGLFTDLTGEQTCAIVPNPGNENLYYIFHSRQTASADPYIQRGLYYSVVDFSQDPLGEVTLKNVRLRDNMTSRIATTYDYATDTFRVITIGALAGSTQNDTFFIWTVDETGMPEELQPEITTQDLDLSGIGQLKISPDNASLAVANGIDQRVHVYDLDISSGTITFDKSVIVYEFMAPYEPYGVAFSQDSKFLYISKNLNGSGVIDKVWVNQPPEAGEEERWSLGGSANLLGSLQLARNGNIYVARHRSQFRGESLMGVIRNAEHLEPEAGTGADYQADIDLEGGFSTAGLPNFPSALLRPRILAESTCLGESQVFSVDSFRSVPSASWDFGDGTTTTDISPTHTYTAPGLYTVRVTVPGRHDHPVTLYRDFYVHPQPPLDASTVLIQCDPDNDGTEIFNLDAVSEKITPLDYPYQYDLTFYHSAQDRDTGSNPIENPAHYQNQANPEIIFVTITNEFGCMTQTSFSILAEYHSVPPIADFVVCEDSDGAVNDDFGLFALDGQKETVRQALALPESYTIRFYPSQADAVAQSGELTGDVISPSATLWVRVDDAAYDCNGIGKMNLVVNPPVQTEVPGQVFLCGNQGVQLAGNPDNTAWEWKRTDGPDVILSTEREITLTEIGAYQLTEYLTANGITCSLVKPFVTLLSGSVAFASVVAGNGEIAVTVSGNSSYEFSLDAVHYYGSGLSYTFSQLPAGVYTVYVRDVNDCETPISMDVAIIRFDSYFTPNGDGINDWWTVQDLRQFFPVFEVEIFNRYGTFLYGFTDHDTYGWDGRLKGRDLPATDYWFKAEMIDSQGNRHLYHGHFALKR